MVCGEYMKMSPKSYGINVLLKSVHSVRSISFLNGVVSIPCCQELVKEGKECHDTLVKYIAERPSLIGNESKYLQKRDEVWAHCVSVSKALSPA
ncbi:hypothetical protein HID58_076223 [Brassica napus]|uniref:Prolamin-like domain-containing protein n=1 Tax=Brassica napus TaxID=3708 RepID=A0ABQ7YQ09_BRANA|nr:hypothetical protein HID58_076223 [Brassica napus]